MQNSMAVFLASVLGWKYLFGQVWSKKWKLSVSGEIWYIVYLKYEELNGYVHSFHFLTILRFMANLFQKIKIVCWNWNLEPWLIWICKIQWWCSFFIFFGDILDLFCIALSRKSIWHFDVIWLISQQVINFKIILTRKHFFYLTWINFLLIKHKLVSFDWTFYVTLNW